MVDLRYKPQDELEKIAVDAFKESPNTKELSEMLEGQPLKEHFLAVAERGFIEGFVTVLRSLGGR